jgi:hypothetical protein
MRAATLSLSMQWSVGFLLALAVASHCNGTQSPPPSDSNAPPPPAAAPRTTSHAAGILADRALWGRDFAAALRALPAYQSAGEEKVLVFDDRVVGDTKYRAQSAALQAAANVGVEMRALRQAVQAPSAVLDALQTPSRELGTPTPMVLAEDRALHVGNAEPDLELLAPGLEITAVASRHGNADTTRTVAIDDGTERRPRILKLYSYDNGAIVFATSTGAVNPDAVERVILDAKVVSDAVR